MSTPKRAMSRPAATGPMIRGVEGGRAERHRVDDVILAQCQLAATKKDWRVGMSTVFTHGQQQREHADVPVLHVAEADEEAQVSARSAIEIWVQRSTRRLGRAVGEARAATDGEEEQHGGELQADCRYEPEPERRAV